MHVRPNVHVNENFTENSETLLADTVNFFIYFSVLPKVDSVANAHVTLTKL